MSFLDLADQYQSFDFDGYFQGVTPVDVGTSLGKAGDMNRLDVYDLLNLLSPAAAEFLEPMAQKARELTLQYFGRTIGLYAPMYISDFCSNHCTYCGFNAVTDFPRTRLTMEEIETEAKAIADLGIRHILVLTGEAPAKTPMGYLEEAVSILARHFSSIALEMFPMEEADYRQLSEAGADSLTVYQEVYDQALYKEVHPKGPKSDYAFRLLTPERGARAGFRALNIGTLFGLGKPGAEAFMAGLHARYLEQEFPHVEVSLSLPRMTKAEGGIAPKNHLSDAAFVQTMLAWRLFMPRLGITVSTRESAAFRDRLIHLGATRYSAGSKTDVGGYLVRNPGASSGEPGGPGAKNPDTTVQFEITDNRSVSEITEMIRASGYQPVFKDWEIF
ncbi:MAG: 2-iminoacetate synthase ThiH [Desulfobacterales bacterium]|nr:2-iminoacetate synthase ThiH [Desulfobacterales bacterium]